MKWIQKLTSYIRYLRKVQDKAAIHSPFINDLLTNVIKEKNRYYIFDDIEKLRHELLHCGEVISVTDKGSGCGGESRRSIRHIAGNSAISANQGQLLFRLVNHFKPRRILELGTSLGIGTLYLATFDKNIQVVTIEGCPETAARAKKNFEKFERDNIRLEVDSFEEALPHILTDFSPLDFVFFDGNHRCEATLSYFNLCKAHICDKSIFIFHDIHWSEDMESAWELIKNDSLVTITIDLFSMGLVFFIQGMGKEDFTLR